MRSNPVSLLLVALAACDGAACNGDATPGPRNLHPIDTAAPKFVRQVPNGKLYTIGQEGDVKDLIHLWGTPYENGYAMGQLVGPKAKRFIGEVYDYLEGQIVSNLANATWCAEFPTRCEGLRVVMKMGLEAALNLSYHQTAPYIQPYVMQEIQGLADSTGMSVTDIRDVMWLGEITRGACSMFGAKGSATQSRGGKLLQLRSLDWDVDGPFRNFATLVVYHPNAGDGYAWANLGFTGWTASITGFSEKQIGLSEIGVTYADESFGPETYLAKGVRRRHSPRPVLPPPALPSPRTAAAGMLMLAPVRSRPLLLDTRRARPGGACRVPRPSAPPAPSRSARSRMPSLTGRKHAMPATARSRMPSLTGRKHAMPATARARAVPLRVLDPRRPSI